jgi:DNA-binding MarR family transcriptional regulator
MGNLDNDVAKLENAIRLFVQAIKRPQRWAAITAETGINVDRPSAVILHKLIEHEPKQMRVQDLARELGIEPPSITRKTQLLEELGYIQRLPDAGDKRAVSLKVTPAGHKVTKKLWQAQRQSMVDVLANWPADERHQLATLLERFSQQLIETI